MPASKLKSTSACGAGRSFREGTRLRLRKCGTRNPATALRRMNCRNSHEVNFTMKRKSHASELMHGFMRCARGWAKSIWSRTARLLDKQHFLVCGQGPEIVADERLELIAG